MKKLLSIILLILIVGVASAQGIKFFNGDLTDALKKASKKDKLVFVDAYTTWCGPCKMMARDVFTDKEVGNFYNKHFINLKIDQEKGEGIEFAKKYDVVAYPTLIFLNAEGELAHKIIGYQNVQEFLAFAKDAMNEEKQILALSKLYTYGYGESMEPELMKNYANALKNAWMPDAGVVAQDYINTIDQSNWLDKENAEFILEHFPSDVENELFKFIVENTDEFVQYDESEEKFYERIEESLGFYLRLNEDLSDEKVLSFYQEFFPNDWKKRYSLYEIALLKQNDEIIEAYVLAQLAFFEEYGIESWQELNQLAWTIYEKSDDPEILELGREVAMQSIEMDENYYNVDTYTWLSYKLGDYANTLIYGRKAIELGKADEFEVNELEDMLDSIEQ